MKGTFRWAVLVWAVGCGGSQGADEVAIEPEQQTEREAAPDLAAAKAEVNAVIETQYAAMGRGDMAAWAEPFTADALVWGSAHNELWRGREEATRESLAFIEPITANGGTFSVRSTGPWVLGMSPDGRAAWFADEAEVTIAMGDQQQTMSMRVSEVLVQSDDGAWQAVAWVNSIGVPNEQAFAIARAGKWPTLEPVPENVPPGAEAVAALLDQHLADASAASDAIEPDGIAYMFGSAPEEKGHVDEAFKDNLIQAMKTWHAEIARKDGPYVGLAPGGQLAWLGLNADYTVQIEGKPVTQPYRGLTVYVKHGDDWRIAHWHWSNGVPNEGLPE